MQVKQLVDGWCTAHACTLLGGETKEPRSDGVVGLALEQVQLVSPMGRRYVRRRPSYASAGPSARSHVTQHGYPSHPAHLDRRSSYAVKTYYQMCDV